MKKPKLWKNGSFWYCGRKEDRNFQTVGLLPEVAYLNYTRMYGASHKPFTLWGNISFTLKATTLTIWNMLLLCATFSIMFAVGQSDFSLWDKTLATSLAASILFSWWLVFDYTVEKIKELWSKL